MTKSILTIYITIYSLLRIFSIGGLYYYDMLTLPLVVILITISSCIISLIIAYVTYTKELDGKNLRLSLFLFAIISIINVALTLLHQVDILHMAELLVTGTLFDILLFLASLTLHFGNDTMEDNEFP